MIRLNGITKNYYDGKDSVNVLKETTLSIEAGEFSAIVGPSGSGKSTLLTIIGVLQNPSKGTLYLNGKDVSSLSAQAASDLRFDSIGFILQGSNLVPFLTVYEQFEMKLKQAKVSQRDDVIDEILTMLDIQGMKKKYPDELSGGERQRVAIGLSLVLKPKIILADEPTASLDTKKAFQVIEILSSVARKMNTAVVMVTHDERMLQYCDRIFQMNDGVLGEVQRNL